MPTAHIVRAFTFLVLLGIVAAVAHAVPAGEPRAKATVEALSTGDPAIYEKAAQENFTPAMLARRTPEARADMVKTVHGDFGALEIDAITADAEGLHIATHGKGGKKLRLTFVFDGMPEARIQSMSIEMGGGDGPAVKLPPLNLTGSMSDADRATAIDGWIAPLAGRDAFAGVVLVARDGKPVFLRAYGPADREKKIAASEDTAYNIASIGKKFTQTAIGKLLQDGKLKLTTTIGDVIPDYPNAVSRSATIDQLVNMKGGIADFFGPGFDKVDKTKLNSNHAYFEYVSKLPPLFAPGAQEQYCNGCYVVLGEIVERITHTRFEDVVQRTVFTPAGMARTGYFNTANLPANIAVSYGRVRGPNTPYENTRPLHGATGSGAGGVYSTAKDLLAFDEALRASRLVDATTAAWVLRGEPATGRNHTPMGIGGGGPGTNAVLESGGRWTVIVTANVDPPLPETMGVTIARALAR